MLEWLHNEKSFRQTDIMDETVLIIEDDSELQRLLQIDLQRRGVAEALGEAVQMAWKDCVCSRRNCRSW